MKTVRAVALIGAGLAALSIIVAAVMILIASQVEVGRIDARVQTLLAQGEIIAMAIASQRTEPDAINVDPEFPVSPERVAPLVRRLITPMNARARIYGRDGTLILDTGKLYGPGDVLRFDLPPSRTERLGIVERTFTAIRSLLLGRSDLPPYREAGLENGRSYSEVAQALDGEKASMVRINDHREVVVLVAIPIQRLRTVHGALLLSALGGGIKEGGIKETMFIPVLKVSIYVLTIALLFVSVFASIRSRRA
jgi:two-component system, OmpR family, sensor histidine kinase ChvG